MMAFSSGIAELRYRHPDDPLQWRHADFEGLSSEHFDILESELLVGGSRFAARVLVRDQPTTSAPPSRQDQSATPPSSSDKPSAGVHEPFYRSRGPRPVVGPRVEAAMRADIEEGKITLTELRDMKQVEMQVRYQASAEVCRVARDRVLADLGGNPSA
jgi:hypothetical protein